MNQQIVNVLFSNSPSSTKVWRQWGQSWNSSKHMIRINEMSLMKNDTSWTSAQTHPSMFSNSPKLYLALTVQTHPSIFLKVELRTMGSQTRQWKIPYFEFGINTSMYKGFPIATLELRPALEEKTLSIWAIFRFAKILRRQPPWVEVTQEMAPRMMCFCGSIWIQRFSSSTRIEPAAASFFWDFLAFFEVPAVQNAQLRWRDRANLVGLWGATPHASPSTRKKTAGLLIFSAESNRTTFWIASSWTSIESLHHPPISQPFSQTGVPEQWLCPCTKGRRGSWSSDVPLLCFLGGSGWSGNALDPQHWNRNSWN